jgi:hypothetical protein
MPLPQKTILRPPPLPNKITTNDERPPSKHHPCNLIQKEEILHQVTLKQQLKNPPKPVELKFIYDQE